MPVPSTEKPFVSNFFLLYFKITYFEYYLWRLDPTKYFGIELGAQTHIDATNERYIVNGSHDEDKLQGIWSKMTALKIEQRPLS